jgi:peroxiredoxin family protein
VAQKKKKLALIVQSGTIDKLYCAFILASTAVAMNWEAHLYFTFWGLSSLVKKNLERMKYPTPYEMLKRLKQSGLFKIYACTPTMEMFGIKKEDLIPEVDSMVGAATFLNIAADSDVNLFI